MIKRVQDGLTVAMIFIVDMLSLMQDTGQQIDWDIAGVARYRRGAIPVRNTTAVVAGDVTVAVAALPSRLPKGSVIDFGVGDRLVTTADAEAGALSVAINPAHSAIADETTGYAIMEGYRDYGYLIPEGTVMARNATNKKLFPRAVRPGAETAECVLLTNAKNDSQTDSLTGYGVTYAGVMYENLMPDFADAAWATFKTELSARFVWKTYRDSRGA
jgi:hypothetical protein